MVLIIVEYIFIKMYNKNEEMATAGKGGRERWHMDSAGSFNF